MIDEAPEPSLRRTFDNHILREIQDDQDGGWATGWSSQSAVFSDESWGSVIVQLRALRLITNGTKKRTVSDKSVYWTLTPAGDEYLVELKAMPHDPAFGTVSAPSPET